MHKNILKKFINSDRFPSQKVKAVYLFGSRARGDHKADSDYDLLILVRPNFDVEDSNKLYEAVMDILVETGNVLSLKIFKISEYKKLLRLQTPFVRNISKEAVTVENLF